MSFSSGNVYWVFRTDSLIMAASSKSVEVGQIGSSVFIPYGQKITSKQLLDYKQKNLTIILDKTQYYEKQRGFYDLIDTIDETIAFIESYDED